MRAGFGIGLLTGIALLLLVWFGGVTGQAGTPPFAQASPAAPSGVSSRTFAQAAPAMVEPPELALTNVIIEPGASIPSHHHPGTEIGSIVSGELHYTVETGTILVRRADAPADAAPEPIPPGSTVALGPGDTVIEHPDGLHHVENRGDEPVVIWLASLFPEGAPRTEYTTTPAP